MLEPITKLVNVRVVSNFLGVKIGTIYKWTHLKRIPFVKVGGRVRFDLLQIQNWLLDKQFKPNYMDTSKWTGRAA